MNRPLTCERNADFAARLIEIAGRKRSESASARQIIEEALTQQPRRFYLSFDAATRVVPYIIRHKRFFRNCDSSESQYQWLDFAGHVREYLHHYPSSTLRKAILYVLCHRRPRRFYIGFETALDIFNQTLRNVNFYTPQL